MQELLDLLSEKDKTISTMESCTGGGIANAITIYQDRVMFLNKEL